jgi:DNA end-binding protein Ku
VMRNTEYLAAIRPLDGALAMSTMRFADEVIDRSEVVELDDLDPPAEREVKLAVQIIDSLTADWDPSAYHDEFTGQIRTMIEEKARGREVISVPESGGPAEGRVVDLMEALEQSVEAAKKPARKGKKSA